MRLLTDADSLVYACGFATQKMVVFDKEPELVVEPVENSLALCKKALEAIFTDMNAWLALSGESCKYLECHITGPGNFRDALATIKPYKGSRKLKPKPVHYEALRTYLTREWGATTAVGYEADDALAMEAHACGYDPDRLCIVSQDKDLKTVPGLLYSYRKKESYLLTEQDAKTFFYRQILMGDSTDDVVGVWKCGAKKAEKLITDGMTDAEMWAVVLAEFTASLPRPACPYTDPLAAAIETAQLLHLKRTPEDMWSPPKL